MAYTLPVRSLGTVIAPWSAAAVFGRNRTQISLLRLPLRHFHSLPQNPRPFAFPTPISILVPARCSRPTLSTIVPWRRSIWNSSQSFSSGGSTNHLAHLEQVANNNPASASAQNAFYSALLRSNLSQVVVSRYESGSFASSPACDALYTRALERMNAAGNTSAATAATVSDNSQSGLLKKLLASKTAQGAGNNTNSNAPLRIVIEDSWGSKFYQLARIVILFATVIWIISAFSYFTSELSGMLSSRLAPKDSEVKPETVTVKFSDVHGCDEAKQELKEVVDFLKSPGDYAGLGGKLPRGILLVGPPGTGKTLLARAVAGEAEVPFFYMSGSEFDEMYVGVGAKRVRHLFDSARAKSPAIIFIDEIDAVGGKRSSKDHMFAKQTLNQLLTELDGFKQDTNIILIAATNFPGLLDHALTRPGRFDRRVIVSLPDVRGRAQIVNYYLNKLAVEPNVDPMVIARGTPGMSGADLQNLTNQAAIHASKLRAKAISMNHLQWAKDRIVMGAENRSRVMKEDDKVQTAYHEGGHTLVALLTKHTDPLYKVTIIPRGKSLGATHMLPEDRVSQTKQEYIARLDVMMGGKVAEELVYGAEAVTGGASNDIQVATRLAYAMVTQLGMSDRLGPVDLHSNYSSVPAKTRQAIWEEISRLLEEAHARAAKLLATHRKELDRIAKALVEYETLSREEVEKVVKGIALNENKIKLAPNAPLFTPPPASSGTLMPAPPPPPDGLDTGVQTPVPAPPPSFSSSSSSLS